MPVALNEYIKLTILIFTLSGVRGIDCSVLDVFQTPPRTCGFLWSKPSFYAEFSRGSKAGMRKFKIDTSAPKPFTLAAKTTSKRAQLTYGEMNLI